VGCDLFFVKMMVKILLGVAWLGAAGSVGWAGVARSPDVGHVDAFDRMTDHQLRWVPAEGGLVASVTFSNVDFVSREEPRRDYQEDFYLPGIRLDARNGVFYDADGVAVAVRRREMIGSEIRLLPGARIWIANRSGRVSLALTATSAPRSGLRWVESDQVEFPPNWFG
jgi:hypothetical protein